MFKNRLCNDFLLLGAAGLLLTCAIAFHQVSPFPIFTIDKQDSAHNINRDFLKLISMGNKRLFSSSIWIKTLLESDETHYSKRDTNSWMYHRFRSISELDPLFYENYLWGGMFLSIVKDDLEGAANLYERGLLFFPTDYKLNYNSGFNYFYEMGEIEKGLQKLLIIKDLPQTPVLIKFVINRLTYQTNNDHDSALAFLNYNLENTHDKKLQKKIKGEMNSIKIEKDLECLNSNQSGCGKQDIFGNSYVLKNGKWESSIKYIPYRIHNRR